MKTLSTLSLSLIYTHAHTHTHTHTHGVQGKELTTKHTEDMQKALDKKHVEMAQQHSQEMANKDNQHRNELEAAKNAADTAEKESIALKHRFQEFVQCVIVDAKDCAEISNALQENLKKAESADTDLSQTEDEHTEEEVVKHSHTHTHMYEQTNVCIRVHMVVHRSTCMTYGHAHTLYTSTSVCLHVFKSTRIRMYAGFVLGIRQ